MRATTQRVDSMGRVLIPAKLRRELLLEPGTEVRIAADGGKLTVQSRRQVIREIQEKARRLIPKGVSVVDEFIRERRQEARRELAD